MTEVTKELILDLHNKYRAAEKAADMLKMVRWLHDKYKRESSMALLLSESLNNYHISNMT